MPTLPKDSNSRRTDERARAIVHYQINADRWIYREETGTDVGIDCRLELSEDDEFHANRVEVQIKGTKVIENYRLKHSEVYSYPVDLKTINYGLSCSSPFAFFLVDVVQEKVYVVPLQTKFIETPDMNKRVVDASQNKQTKFSLHFPVSQVLPGFEEELVHFSKMSFVGAPGEELRVAK